MIAVKQYVRPLLIKFGAGHDVCGVLGLMSAEQLGEATPMRNPAIKWRKEGSKIMLGQGMALNELGAFIWDCCDGLHTVEQIITEICHQYAVESRDAVCQDVQDFLLDLYANDLILLP